MLEGTIIVGAGIAGLACGQALHRAGRDVVLLERAQVVGGRCATLRLEGQLVDLGPMFFHGDHPGFLRALEDLAGTPGAAARRDWPGRVEGGGSPCQPDALAAPARRMVFAQGMNTFARHLAAGLDIHQGATVSALQPVDGGFRVQTTDGEAIQGRDLVLALAVEETRALLGTLPDSPLGASIQALLGMFASSPAITLVAGYPLAVPMPAWDLLLPAGVLQLIARDSSKRVSPPCHTLVCQARSGWSRARMALAPARWVPELLAEATAVLGPWAGAPLWTHPHVERYARVDRSAELAQPVRMRFPGGPTLGLAGDVFAPGGGVQAAWLSGSRLAESLLQENGA